MRVATRPLGADDGKFARKRRAQSYFGCNFSAAELMQ